MSVIQVFDLAGLEQVRISFDIYLKIVFTAYRDDDAPHHRPFGCSSRHSRAPCPCDAGEGDGEGEWKPTYSKGTGSPAQTTNPSAPLASREAIVSNRFET